MARCRAADAGGVQAWLGQYRQWPLFPPRMRGLAAGSFTATFAALGARTLGEGLDGIYFHFRNRLHFGTTAQYRRTNNIEHFPLLSPAMLELAQRAPRSLVMSDQIIFDLTRELCSAAAHLPYDQPLRIPCPRCATASPSCSPAPAARWR